MSLWHRFSKLLFEVALLKRIERTGYAYLGTGRENVAGHAFGVIFCAWLLTKLCEEQVDEEKVLKMALIHDLPEARIGDFNAVNKLYNQADEDRALRDALVGMPIEKEVLSLWEEYKKMETLEAKLVHDADILDLIVQLKEQKDLNNPFAERWLIYAKRRLLTPVAKKLAEAITEIEWCSWWLEHFVKRDEKRKEP